MARSNQSIDNFITQQNSLKSLFTAGPASLLAENLTGLRPCFGRGDNDYAQVEESVLSSLLKMTGHEKIVRMQGSASLALEIMAMNFLTGRVLVVSTGYYSDRLKWLADSACRRIGAVKEVCYQEWENLDKVNGKFDWILSCYVETSCGLKLPIDGLHKTAKRLGAKLMLDATASIGLEEGHYLADVIAFSSCKGLFGLTGACFICYNSLPVVEVDSFYLSIDSHVEKKMTGPYHAICSLYDVLPKHEEFRAAVITNKNVFQEMLPKQIVLPKENQPFLCTHVSCDVVSSDPEVVLYKPRSNLKGSVVCHLGEVHLGLAANGDIFKKLKFQ